MFPLLFFQEWEEVLSPFLQPLTWVGTGVRHHTTLVEPMLLLQGREERGPFPTEKTRTLPERINVTAARRGCCLGELAGASYSECKGIGHPPQVLANCEDKESGWLRELL